MSLLAHHTALPATRRRGRIFSHLPRALFGVCIALLALSVPVQGPPVATAASETHRSETATAPRTRPTAAALASITPLAGLTQAWTAKWRIATMPAANTYPSLPTSSPAIGDVTGDGKPDVVVGGLDSYLRVFNAGTGALELSTKLDGPIQSSPVLVDLYGLGTPQVLISSASTNPGPKTSATDVYSFAGGTPRRLFHGSTAQPGSGNLAQAFLATPSYGDIDGDGKPEIVAVNLIQYLYAWHLDGTPAFPPKFMYDTLVSSPTLVDWDHDGKDEIVFGGDMDPNYVGSPFPNAKGLIWSVQGNGATSPGYPIQIPDQVVWSPITVTDLRGDGGWVAVVDTGMNYLGGGNEVYAYDLASRQPLSGFPTPVAGATYSDPAVVSLPGENSKTIITGTGRGWVYAIGADGRVRWRQCTLRFSPCTENRQVGPDFLQVMPVVADIDNDGRTEVVVTTEKDLKVYDAATGAARNVQVGTDGSLNGPVTLVNALPNAASPSIAEINGHTTIYIHGIENVGAGASPSVGDNGFLQAWTLPKPLGTAPWPTFKGGFTRSGVEGTLTDVLPSTRSFIRAAYQDFLGRAPTPGELTRDSQDVGYHRKSKAAFLTGLSTSDRWLNAIITGFYQQTLGRDPDPSGLAYWADILRGRRLTVASVAASFYASSEYFTNIGGGTVYSWLTNLYVAVLQRNPDAGGLNYWAARVAAKGRNAVTYAFYQSQESAQTRVKDLYVKLLARGPDPAGLDYWAGIVPIRGDLTLAMLLANSAEYQGRAIARFPDRP